MLMSVTALDHRQAQPSARQELLAPRCQFSRVAAIDKDTTQPTKALRKDREDQFGSVPILDGRRVDDHMQDQAQRVHQEVSFASQDLLARIVATHSSVVRYFNALRIEDRSARGFFFPLWSLT